MEIHLPPLEPWQKEVFTAMENAAGTSNIYVVKAKRQVGKSVLAVVELCYFALGQYRTTTNVVLEPTLNQSRRMFKQIVDIFEQHKLIKKANETLLTIEFINGSEILFKSAEQREGLRGFTVNGLMVIDEAAYIADDIFEIIFPAADANKAPILIISTPLFTDGIFYELYSKGQTTKGIQQGIFSFDWNDYDTSKYLNTATLERYRETLTPNKFRSEYLGEFITDGSYVFGNINNSINKETPDMPPMYGGIDWAAGGNGDDTVLTLMDGECKVTEILCLNNMTPTEQVNRIKDFLSKHPTVTKLQVELNSIGAVYYDLLKNTLTNVHIIGFNTLNESKCRIIEQLINAFETGKIKIIDDAKLKLELQHYEQQKLKNGYTYNGAKGYHDDYVISLALVYDIARPNQCTYSVAYNGAKKHKIRLSRFRDLYD